MMFVSTKDFEKVLLYGDWHPISEEDNRPNESNPVALFAFFFHVHFMENNNKYPRTIH